MSDNGNQNRNGRIVQSGRRVTANAKPKDATYKKNDPQKKQSQSSTDQGNKKKEKK